VPGGAPFHTTSTRALEFPGARSFAPLFHAKGRGLDAASRQPLRRAPTSRAGPTLQRLSACAEKTCTEPVRRNWYRFRRDFVQLVLVLDQFCPVEQLFPPRLRATFERKLKYETVHTIVYPESLPVAGSKGLPGSGGLPARGAQDCPATAIPIFSLREPANSNR